MSALSQIPSNMSSSGSEFVLLDARPLQSTLDKIVRSAFKGGIVKFCFTLSVSGSNISRASPRGSILNVRLTLPPK